MHIFEPGTSFSSRIPGQVYVEDLPYDGTDKGNGKFCFR